MNPTQRINSFSIGYDKIEREILTPIHLSVPIMDSTVNLEDPRIISTTALWDTGATNCVITKAMVDKMGLKPVGIAQINHAGGVMDVSTYYINIYLPNNIMLRGVTVSECVNKDDKFGILIGMDIIALGDFAITNTNKKTFMSFRMPSIEKINFVSKKELVGRNELCPCRSGKKYKHCCGANA